jgi:hypothetical protein
LSSCRRSKESLTYGLKTNHAIANNNSRLHCVAREIIRCTSSPSKRNRIVVPVFYSIPGASASVHRQVRLSEIIGQHRDAGYFYFVLFRCCPVPFGPSRLTDQCVGHPCPMPNLFGLHLLFLVLLRHSYIRIFPSQCQSSPGSFSDRTYVGHDVTCNLKRSANLAQSVVEWRCCARWNIFWPQLTFPFSASLLFWLLI